MRKTLKSLFKRGPIGYKLFQGQIPVAVHFLSALSASISVSLSPPQSLFIPCNQAQDQ